jgi:putative flippase GtrA
LIDTQQFSKWVLAPTNHTALQVPRAIVVSVFAAALDFGVLVLLVERFAWSPVPAAVVSYLLGGVLQYVLCAWWVFPASPQNLTIGIVAFTVLSLVGLGITWATIGVLHDSLQVNYVAAKFAALGLAFTWNFLSRKYLLFPPRRVVPDKPAALEATCASASLVCAEDIEEAILPFACIAAPQDALASRPEAPAEALEHVEA